MLEMGGLVAPCAGLSFLLAFPLCAQHNLGTPGQALWPLLLGLLAAHAAAWCECRQREWQNSLSARVDAWCAGRGGLSPGQATLRAALCRALWQLALYLACFLTGNALLAACRPLLPSLAGLTWGMLYAAACVGPLLSLRTRRAYAVLLAVLAALSLAALLR